MFESIIVVAILLAAVTFLVRRWIAQSKGESSCGCGGGCAGCGSGKDCGCDETETGTPQPFDQKK